MKKSRFAKPLLAVGLAFSMAGCAEGVGATQPPETSQESGKPNVQKSAGACAITGAKLVRGLTVTLQLSNPEEKRKDAIFFTSTRVSDPASPSPVSGPVGFPAKASGSGEMTGTNTDPLDFSAEDGKEPFTISVETLGGVKDTCGTVVVDVDGGVRINDGPRIR